LILPWAAAGYQRNADANKKLVHSLLVIFLLRVLFPLADTMSRDVQAGRRLVEQRDAI
jgi:hypothetical protein